MIILGIILMMLTYEFFMLTETWVRSLIFVIGFIVAVLLAVVIQIMIDRISEKYRKLGLPPPIFNSLG